MLETILTWLKNSLNALVTLPLEKKILGAFCIASIVLAGIIKTPIANFGFQNIFSGLLPMIIIASVAVLIIYLIAKEIGTVAPFDLKPPFEDEKDFFDAVKKYWVWGLAQQLVLLCVYFDLCYFFPIDRAWVIVISALIFSYGFHRPNATLISWTLALALVNLILFSRYGNIWALAFIHGTAGTFLCRFMPPIVSTSFGIGKDYVDAQKSAMSTFDKNQ